MTPDPPPTTGRVSRASLLNGLFFRVVFVFDDDGRPPPDGGFVLPEACGSGVFRFEPIGEPDRWSPCPSLQAGTGLPIAATPGLILRMSAGRPGGLVLSTTVGPRRRGGGDPALLISRLAMTTSDHGGGCIGAIHGATCGVCGGAAEAARLVAMGRLECESCGAHILDPAAEVLLIAPDWDSAVLVLRSVLAGLFPEAEAA